MGNSILQDLIDKLNEYNREEVEVIKKLMNMLKNYMMDNIDKVGNHILIIL